MARRSHDTMIRVFTLLLAIMVMAMSVPALAALPMAAQGANMPDCAGNLPTKGHPAVPMAADCQKCCLATFALPTIIAQPMIPPLPRLTERATHLEPHLATPEPPPPRSV